MEQTFYDVAHALNWNEITDFIYSRSEDDVIRALKKERISMEDFAALISPAASAYLEKMAEKSYLITRRRFGNATVCSSLSVELVYKQMYLLWIQLPQPYSPHSAE